MSFFLNPCEQNIIRVNRPILSGFGICLLKFMFCHNAGKLVTTFFKCGSEMWQRKLVFYGFVFKFFIPYFPESLFKPPTFNFLRNLLKKHININRRLLIS